MSTEPFFKLPRRFAADLKEGRLTPTAFSLIAYLGAAGVDRFGVMTTLRELSELFERSTKTMSHTLRSLRDRGFVKFELAERQRKPFRITAGPTLSDPSSAVVSAVASANGSAVGSATSAVASNREAASRKGSKPLPTSASSAVAETRDRETRDENQKDETSSTGVAQDVARAGDVVAGDASQPEPFDLVTGAMVETSNPAGEGDEGRDSSGDPEAEVVDEGYFTRLLPSLLKDMPS